MSALRRLSFGVGAAALVLMVRATCVAQTSSQTGCQVSGARTGFFALTATDGRQVVRRYLLQVPKSYSPQKAYPLVFVFHGKGGTAEQSHSWGLQEAKGAAEGAIFVYPQGALFRDYGVGWDDGNNGYDMPFFDAMLRAVEAGYCVDAAEVFAVGFSWGGDFVTALACARGGKIRAVEVNSATDDYGDQSEFKTYRGLPCPSREQPAIRFEHAVERDSAYPPPSFATSTKLYQFFDRCSAASTPVASKASYESCVAYSGCAKELVECSFDKSIGHKLPPNWAQDTWDFFQSFLRSQ